MPRLMSFKLTKNQIRNRTKTVTRRLGWQGLKQKTNLVACEQCQGLKKGEKIIRICLIQTTQDARPECLDMITQEEVIKEGFPGMTVLNFIDMFIQHMWCKRNQVVNRIEFEYIEEKQLLLL